MLEGLPRGSSLNTSYILFFLYIKFSYKISWKGSFITAILSILLVGMVELISYFPFAFVFFERFTESTNNLMAAALSVVFCYIIVKFVPIWQLKKWCRHREIWYIAVISVSILFMAYTIINYNMTLELDLGDYIYITVCVLLMWLLCWRLMKYRYEEKIRKKYFDAFYSVIDQIKRRQHKFQNQLDAVYSLHNLYDDYDVLVQEQRKYLKKLTDYEMPADILILENPILIAHVFEKISEAQESGLSVRMKLKCSLEKCGLEDIHMVEILGTLFDNAIQDMIETGQTEFLIFEVEKDEGIVIRVANPHREMENQEMRKMFEAGYSTKGENRGIGLYHVKKLIQKHKIELLVESKMIKNWNYICFSVMIGRNTPLV